MADFYNLQCNFDRPSCPPHSLTGWKSGRSKLTLSLFFSDPESEGGQGSASDLDVSVYSCCHCCYRWGFGTKEIILAQVCKPLRRRATQAPCVRLNLILRRTGRKRMLQDFHRLMSDYWTRFTTATSHFIWSGRCFTSYFHISNSTIVGTVIADELVRIPFS